MEYKEICEIIKSVSESKLTFAEIKTKDIYIKMGKESTIKETNIDTEKINSKEELKEELKEEKITIKEQKVTTKEYNIEVITAPLVGTFYGSASPDSEPYVQVGSKVKKGEIVCIVEAMKLMNEIECQVEGEIVEILVENEEMVEYNQPLFKVRKA